MKAQSIDNLNALAERLLDAGRVAVLTGAGVSKESGVPTFRDADGLWNKFRPEELANVNAFLANPQRVWEWYNWRRELMSKVEPNPGHFALAELEQILGEFVLITQNVDNLHRVAGSRKIIELHGNILRNKCHSCGKPAEVEPFDARSGELPRCSCGGMIRPDIVWFGEMLPPGAIDAAWEAATNSDVFFSIGTSAVVYPAASLPFEAKNAGAYVVEINPQSTGLSRVADLVLPLPSGEALPKILTAVHRLRNDQVGE